MQDPREENPRLLQLFPSPALFSQGVARPRARDKPRALPGVYLATLLMCLCSVFLELQTKPGQARAHWLQSKLPEGRQPGLVAECGFVGREAGAVLIVHQSINGTLRCLIKQTTGMKQRASLKCQPSYRRHFFCSSEYLIKVCLCGEMCRRILNQMIRTSTPPGCEKSALWYGNVTFAAERALQLGRKGQGRTAAKHREDALSGHAGLHQGRWRGFTLLINICRVGVRRTGPDSFQWCPATGQGATGTNWSRGSSSW